MNGSPWDFGCYASGGRLNEPYQLMQLGYKSRLRFSDRVISDIPDGSTIHRYALYAVAQNPPDHYWAGLHAQRNDPA